MLSRKSRLVLVLLFIALAQPPKIYSEGLKPLNEQVQTSRKKKTSNSSFPSISPVDRSVWIRTSEYGKRSGRMHYGLDIICKSGTPVHATADGEVIRVKTSSGGYGKHIYIKHSSGYETRYAHLKKYKVKLGQKIKQGDVIGFVGKTGNASTYHLHYEIRENGKAFNPRKILGN